MFRKKKLAAALTAIALILLGVSPATAQPVGTDFEFKVWNLGTTCVDDFSFTLTEPSGKQSVLTGMKQYTTYKYPAGTTVSGRIQLKPNRVLTGLGSPDIAHLLVDRSDPSTYPQIAETADGDVFLTYNFSGIVPTQNKYEIQGARCETFNHVFYNLAGGSWQTQPEGLGKPVDQGVYITPGETVNKPVDPIKNGEIFLGWAGESDLLQGKGAPINYSPEDPYRFDEVDTLFAKPGSTDYIRGRLVRLTAQWGRMALEASSTLSNPAKAGDEVKFKLTAKNFSPVAMKNVRFEADGIDTSQCGDTIAARGEIVCEVSYRLQQTDIDTGTLDKSIKVLDKTFNVTANPVSTDPEVAARTFQASKKVSTSILRQYGLKLAASGPLTESGSPKADGWIQDGIVHYQFDLTNTGNTTLNDPMIQVPGLNSSCPNQAIAPGESIKCSATYKVTEADVERGKIFGASSPKAVASASKLDGSRIEQSAYLVAAKTAYSLPSVEKTDLIAGDSVAIVPDYPASVNKASVRILNENGAMVTQLKIDKQGSWFVNQDGEFTFVPVPGFLGEASQVNYTATSLAGVASNAPGTIAVKYRAQRTEPAASTGEQGLAQTVNAKQMFPDVPVSAGASYSLGDDKAAKLEVPGKGTFSVDPDSSTISFTPDGAFLGTAEATVVLTTVNGDTLTSTYTATVTAADMTKFTTFRVTSIGMQNAPQTSWPLQAIFPDLVKDSGANYRLEDADVDGKIVRANEGSYEIANGVVKFTPEPSFVGTPKPVSIEATASTGVKLKATYTPTVIAMDLALPSAFGRASNDGLPAEVTPTYGPSILVSSIRIVDADEQNAKQKTVAGEGTWAVEDGTFKFTPAKGFKGNPAPISYLADSTTGISATVPGQIAIVYPNKPITVTPPPATVTAPSKTVTAPGPTVTVPGPTVTAPGPTVTATRTVAAPDASTPTSTPTVTVTQTVRPPVLKPGVLPNAQAFSSERGVPATASPRYEAHGVDPTSVKLKQLEGAVLAADGKTMTVPGEGRWTVDPVTGTFTFTPEAGFKGNPSPVQYSAEDVLGNFIDDEGEIRVGYAQADCPVGPSLAPSVEVTPLPTTTVTATATQTVESVTTATATQTFERPAATVNVTQVVKERVPAGSDKDKNPQPRETKTVVRGGELPKTGQDGTVFGLLAAVAAASCAGGIAIGRRKAKIAR